MRLRSVLESGFNFLRALAGRFKSLLGGWSERFVFGFMVVLISAAVFLSVSQPVTAEALGVVAYFLLVIGVVLQLVDFVRCRGKREGATD